MLILRVFLLVALLTGAGWLAFHVPWRAETTYNESKLSEPVGESPWYKPPTKPSLTVFKKRISPYLDPKTVDIRVVMDRKALFQRFALGVVVIFLVYGVLGYFLDPPPRGADVAYSLSLTAGYLLGSLASLITAQFVHTTSPLPWLHWFWTAGVLIALGATFLTRQRVVRAA